MQTEVKFNLSSLIRKNIAAMKPYSSARDEFKGEAEVFLDANENPYPSDYNRYPDPLQWKVKNKLAPLKGVAPENIFIGNGSDEPIDLLIRAFCEPNEDNIVITEPTYGMYSVCAEVNAVGIRQVLLTPSYDLDTDALLQSVTASTKVIFLCSPNNPTGALLSRGSIIRVLNEFQGIVVVDEAYIDFSKSESFIKLLPQHPNLVVLQTFSKAWGLAALRCGMAYASTEIISVLNKIKYPYNINIQTQELVLKALDDAEKTKRWVKEILEQRSLLASSLADIPLVEHVYPSDANFLLVKVKNASAIYETLMNEGIIVRDRSKVRLCGNCLRITVGTPEENKRLVEAIRKINL